VQSFLTLTFGEKICRRAVSEALAGIIKDKTITLWADLSDLIIARFLEQTDNEVVSSSLGKKFLNT